MYEVCIHFVAFDVRYERVEKVKRMIIKNVSPQ